MKGALKKELKTTIKFNLSRFISIIVIIFLGVSFFIGMSNNSVVLRKAMNEYLEEYKYWDIKVYSYLGLTQKDIDKIKENVKDIEIVEGKYYVEALTNIEDADGRDTDYPVFVHSYSKDYQINHLKLIAGKEIENDNECVVSSSIIEAGKKIGDYISFTDSSLKPKNYKIVGVVEDPQYISRDKGVSTLQGNMVKYTAYVNESNFTIKEDLYYTFDVRVKDKYERFTTKYDKYVENVKKQIETESESILAVQLDKFVAEKTEELEKAEQEYQEKKEQAENELKQAEDEIKNGERQVHSLEMMLLPDSKMDLYMDTLRANLEASKTALEASKRSLLITDELLDIGKVMYASQRGESNPDLVCTIDTTKPNPRWDEKEDDLETTNHYHCDSQNYCNWIYAYCDDYFCYSHNSIYIDGNNYNWCDKNWNTCGNFDNNSMIEYWQGNLSEDDAEECWYRYYEKQWIQQKTETLFGLEEVARMYQEQLAQMYEYYNSFTCSDIGTTEITKICESSREFLRKQIEEQEKNIEELNQQIQEFHDNLENVETIDSAIDLGKDYVEKSKSIQDRQEELYKEAQKTYNEALAQTSKAERSVNKEITAAEKKIEEAKKELEKKKKEVSDTLEGYYKELVSNRKLLKNVKKHPWVINTRDDCYGYGNYKNDIIRLENIAKIFPMIFFIVASLVTATSISRLVEEERKKIGILKSLGCSKEQIIKKYTRYSLRAAIIGVILGTIAGTIAFPEFTSRIYGVLYYIPKIKYAILPETIIIVLLLSLLSTVTIAYLSANKVASAEPAKLLRYKNVKTTPFINNDGNKGILKYLSNTRKLVYRNIFTSPIRSIMTIAGIMGCTVLVIASFSVRQSIKQYVELQFNRIYNIDAEFYYKTELTQYDIQEDYEAIKKMEDVKNASVGRKDILRMKDDQSIEVYGITPDSAEKFEMDMNLYSVLTKEKTSLKNQTGVIVTEKLAKLLDIHKGDVITFIDGSNLEHTAVVNDICENYLYNYIFMNKRTYEKVYGYELQNNFISIKYKDGVDVELLNTDIFNRDNYSNLISINYYIKTHLSTVKTLDSIIYVIIISAAMLAFVVLYNISKISISEKTIEIATLKVLGYKNKWIGNYIKTELRVLEFIGILLGCAFGYLLSDAVITACETNYMMFKHSISWMGYLYGIITTVTFVFAMNFLIYLDLRKINMSQALKSQEQ